MQSTHTDRFIYHIYLQQIIMMYVASRQFYAEDKQLKLAVETLMASLLCFERLFEANFSIWLFYI